MPVDGLILAIVSVWLTHNQFGSCMCESFQYGIMKNCVVVSPTVFFLLYVCDERWWAESWIIIELVSLSLSSSCPVIQFVGQKESGGGGAA